MSTSTGSTTTAPARSGRIGRVLQKQGALIALVVLVVFGTLRYGESFATGFNVQSVLADDAKYALVALGMCFVIMTGGIDLSVGGVAALSSVVAAMLSTHSWWAGLAGGVGAGLAIGVMNGLIITRMKIQPFIATLAAMLAAYGTALLLANNQSVSVSYDTGFTNIGQEDFLGFPIPAWIAIAAYLLGWLFLERHAFGRHVLAIGDGEATAALMGLKVDRTLLAVYTLSGALAGLAGVILASQFGAGQPTEGVGWELFAIASVVVGGTLLTGGSGSVGATLAGALLLAMVFNILNFENGLGSISLSAYWQSVVRGAFLLLVVIIQARLVARTDEVA
jgi:ribose/xylose/arabinose/galactoside ABC-type transport system permease subunit